MRPMQAGSARGIPDALGVLAVLLLAAGSAGCSSKGLSGIGATCSFTTDCPSGKVCAAGFCADPGNGRLGSPCTATRDCAGGNFCDGVTVDVHNRRFFAGWSRCF